ncbi:flagellar biosynthetic protein FliR [Vibrio crassostreae]|uniref:flagellar biosynthetic protein FliR n=1 Tax=Vibrio crassostreae TaxID=246167 RepID=UPI001B30231C|nr:flagellar biosynthetic protein FliR [Vibrio crassostreae]
MDLSALLSSTLVANLIFFRVIGFFAAAPYFLDFKVPVKVLAIFALLFSYILSINPMFLELHTGGEIEKLDLWICVLNSLVGFVYGFVALLAVNFVKIAGKLIAFAMQMGFSQMVDPVNGKNTDGVSNLIYILFSLCFVSSGGVLIMLGILEDSFVYYPLMNPHFEGLALLKFAESVSLTFLYGVMIAVPFTGVGLLINAGLAVISKSAPSMNLFTIGFPLCIYLGIIGITLTHTELISDLMHFVITLKEKHLTTLI